MKKRLLRLALVLILVLLAASPALAEGDDDGKKQRAYEPWDKAYVQLGGFLLTNDSGVRLGASNLGLGIVLDVEQFLGLKQTNVAFRLDGGWRFTKSGRHALQVSWFRLDRNGENTLTEDITLPPDDDVILEGTTIESIFNFDIIKAKYNYSFILDERIDFTVGGGLYIMPLEIGLGEKGETRTSESVTAPLPVIAVGIDVALGKKWELRQDIDFLYLELSGFQGSILDLNLAVERDVSRRIALGLGVEVLDIEVESESDSDYPLDFDGKFRFTYSGLQFYVKGRF